MSDSMLFGTGAIAVPVDKAADEHRCIVRVTTNFYSDKRGLHVNKSITFLRRQCKGFNVLETDANECGAEDTIARIINLDSVSDGIYEVVTCNERRDWESGTIDSYDYQLV
jgi:hypothetical protein